MKRSTCFLGWKGGRYSFKRNLAIVDWFSGQLAGPMLPLGRLKTHLMFFRLRIFYHEKTQSWDIYLTWVTGRDQSILQQLYAVMFFLLICNGFYQVCPPMVNYYFFPTVNVFFLIRSSISSILHHIWFDNWFQIQVLTISLRLLDFFGWKKWCRPRGVPCVSWVRVFTGNAGKATPWKLRTKKSLQRVTGCLRHQGGSRMKT